MCTLVKTQGSKKSKPKKSKSAKSKPKTVKVYKSLPKGYKVVDPARDLTQARALRKGWPKDANAIIVQTGPSRGNKKAVFPYHIASNHRDYI